MADKTMQLVQDCVEENAIDWFWLAPLHSCTMDDVKAVETALGMRFPAEYAAHLTGEYPGIFLMANDDVWPKTRRGGAFWMFMYSLHTFTAAGPGDEVEEEMRLVNAGRAFMEDTGLKAVPILKWQLDADCWCVDEDGDIARFSHETGELTKTGLGFWELFERELRQLQTNAERMKALTEEKK
ncbi:MAG: hypothetical protein LBJ11_05465 [Oscillospiraceae bacterium]|nr:hypothetical protein [Oscillospiraceae bacterium]